MPNSREVVEHHLKNEDNLKKIKTAFQNAGIDDNKDIMWVVRSLIEGLDDSTTLVVLFSESFEMSLAEADRLSQELYDEVLEEIYYELEDNYERKQLWYKEFQKRRNLGIDMEEDYTEYTPPTTSNFYLAFVAPRDQTTFPGPLNIFLYDINENKKYLFLKIGDLERAASYISPAWSPDGKRFAFSSFYYGQNKKNGSGVYCFNGDSEKTEYLWGVNFGVIENLTFSPDGDKIAFQTLDERGYKQIGFFTLSTNKLRMIPTPADKYISTPCWKNQEQLYCRIWNKHERGSQFVLYNIYRQEIIEEDLKQLIIESRNEMTKLIISIDDYFFGTIKIQREGIQDILIDSLIKDEDGRGLSIDSEYYPSISPDGKHVAFVRERSLEEQNNYARALYVCDVVYGKIKPLSIRFGLQPSWFTKASSDLTTLTIGVDFCGPQGKLSRLLKF